MLVRLSNNQSSWLIVRANQFPSSCQSVHSRLVWPLSKPRDTWTLRLSNSPLDNGFNQKRPAITTYYGRNRNHVTFCCHLVIAIRTRRRLLPADVTYCDGKFGKDLSTFSISKISIVRWNGVQRLLVDSRWVRSQRSEQSVKISSGERLGWT